MRILLAGDTHMNRSWCETLSKLAARHDCSWVVELGDFGYWPNDRNRRGKAIGQTFLDGVDRHAERFGVCWAFVDGNHEDHDALAHLQETGARDGQGFLVVRDRLRYLPRGHRWEWSGVAFGALGGAFSVDNGYRTPGVDWFPTAEEVRPLDVARLGPQRLDVLLAHDAPAGIPFTKERMRSQVSLPADMQARAMAGREQLQFAIENTEPSLLVHGHWHRRYSHTLELAEGRRCQVEGLHGDPTVRGGFGSWLVLTLPNLEVFDARRSSPRRLPAS